MFTTNEITAELKKHSFNSFYNSADTDENMNSIHSWIVVDVPMAGEKHGVVEGSLEAELNTYDSMPRGKSSLMAIVALKLFLLSLQTSSLPRCGALRGDKYQPVSRLNILIHNVFCHSEPEVGDSSHTTWLGSQIWGLVTCWTNTDKRLKLTWTWHWRLENRAPLYYLLVIIDISTNRLQQFVNVKNTIQFSWPLSSNWFKRRNRGRSSEFCVTWLPVTCLSPMTVTWDLHICDLLSPFVLNSEVLYRVRKPHTRVQITMSSSS